MPERTAATEPWWRKAVVYQVYLRSFADSDGDGLGDLAGLRSRLDHIQSLGADVVWVTPFYRSPQADNGYDISDYDSIDPTFGTDADFDALVAELHARGMKLVMDVVLNHTSDQHPWFQASTRSTDNPRRDWYIWRPPREGAQPGTPGAEPTNWLGFFAQPAWTYHEPTGEYYLHLFTPEQPDLNWENPEVRQELFAMLRRWLARGVDGFRMDVINLISKRYPLIDVPPGDSGEYADAYDQFTCGPRMLEFLDELKTQVLDPSGKELLTVGEMPGATIEDARAVTGGEDPRLSMIFTFEHMDVDHAPTWGGRYTPKPFDLPGLKQSMARWQEGLADSGWNSLYFGNHDQARSVSRFGSRDPRYLQRSATLLATVLHLHRGTPYVYQGDELGMTNYPFQGIEDFQDVDALNSWERARLLGIAPELMLAGLRQNSRDNSRTPMQWDASHNGGFTTGTPWMPLNPNAGQVNAAAQVDDEASVFAHYRRLIGLRHEHDVVSLGEFHLLAPQHESIWAFTRTLGTEQWLVAANLSDQPIDLTQLRDVDAPSSAELLLTNLDPDGVEPGALRPWEARIHRIAR